MVASWIHTLRRGAARSPATCAMEQGVGLVCEYVKEAGCLRGRVACCSLHFGCSVYVSCLCFSLVWMCWACSESCAGLYCVYYEREGRFVGSYLYCPILLNDEVSRACAVYGNLSGG